MLRASLKSSPAVLLSGSLSLSRELLLNTIVRSIVWSLGDNQYVLSILRRDSEEGLELLQSLRGGVEREGKQCEKFL